MYGRFWTLFSKLNIERQGSNDAGMIRKVKTSIDCSCPKTSGLHYEKDVLWRDVKRYIGRILVRE